MVGDKAVYVVWGLVVKDQTKDIFILLYENP